MHLEHMRASEEAAHAREVASGRPNVAGLDGEFRVPLEEDERGLARAARERLEAGGARGARGRGRQGARRGAVTGCGQGLRRAHQRSWSAARPRWTSSTSSRTRAGSRTTTCARRRRSTRSSSSTAPGSGSRRARTGTRSRWRSRPRGRRSARRDRSRSRSGSRCGCPVTPTTHRASAAVRAPAEIEDARGTPTRPRVPRTSRTTRPSGPSPRSRARDSRCASSCPSPRRSSRATSRRRCSSATRRSRSRPSASACPRSTRPSGCAARPRTPRPGRCCPARRRSSSAPTTSARREIETVQPGQEFTLHLGADPGVTVKREQIEDQSKGPGFLSNRASDVKSWRVHVENHGALGAAADGSVVVIVRESLPRPRDERIEVELSKSSETESDLVRWKQDRAGARHPHLDAQGPGGGEGPRPRLAAHDLVPQGTEDRDRVALTASGTSLHSRESEPWATGAGPHVHGDDHHVGGHGHG